MDLTEEMIRDVEPGITRLANAFSSRDCPLEDFKQELRMSLISTAARFDDSKANWKTFAYSNLKFRAVDVCRKFGFKSRNGDQNKLRCVGSTDDTVEIDGDTFAKFHEPVDPGNHEMEVDWDDLSRFIEDGGSVESTVWLLRLHGLRMWVIGERLGISESRVSQIMSDKKGLSGLLEAIGAPG